MNIIRSKFERGEEVKYISHLDIMKVFARALRRANLPISYSQGFNPHPRMVFGLPLPVGVTSSSEYVDFEVEGEQSASNFIAELNAMLPKGFRLYDAKFIQGKANIMSSITKASYDIYACVEEKNTISHLGEGENNVWVEIINNSITQYLQNSEILIEKEAKGRRKVVDIKPLIHKINVREDGEKCFCISVLVSAGSKDNLKPEILIKSIIEKTGLELGLIRIHRTGLFIDF